MCVVHWISLIVLLLLVRCGGAVLLEVPTSFPSIQSAFDSSQVGDTVLVAPGTYHEHLRGPRHSIALFSHYTASGDTADIVNTVLDGDLAGTILRVRSWETDSLVLNGFTLTRGLGSHEVEPYEGGAIHVDLHSNLTVRNCAFVGNAGSGPYGQPTAISTYNEFWMSRSNVRLENIALVDNGNLTSYNHSATSVSCITRGTLDLRRIRARSTQPGYTGKLELRSKQSARLEDVVASGADGFRISVIGTQDLTLKDIRFSQCDKSYLKANGRALFATNVAFDEVRIPGQFGSQIDLVGDSCAFIDSLSVTRCRIWGASLDYQQYNMLRLYCGNDSTNYESWVRHFVFTDNVGGDTTSVPGKSSQTNLVTVVGLSLEDGVFCRNTMHFWPDPNDINSVFGDKSDGALLGYGTNMGLIDAHVIRCRFEDNLLLDHDAYMANPWEPIGVNDGRSLWVTSFRSTGITQTQSLEISDLLFRNNRQPNHVPENRNETVSVGSDFGIYNMNGLMDELHVHDIYMESIDDGGIYCWSYANNNHMENMVLRNVNRNGVVALYANSQGVRDLRNVWVNGVIEQDNYLSYPYPWGAQNAVAFGSNTQTNNITITNCNLTNLVGAAGGLNNTVEMNNEYTYLNNPYAQSYYHPVFNYCFSASALSGTGHIQGTDPFFDSILGAPFLATASPCVDAGNPASTYQDPEDPANPGVALWPALGTRRNDMGYTGGPATAPPDTSWVSVPDWHPFTQPKDFTLGAPWPNPFNPTTRIPFTLTRPEIVKLSVHNLLGQEVATLVNGLRMAGRQEVVLDGAGLASGLYFVTIEVNARRESRTITLLR